MTEGLTKMREAFPHHQISKLPKETRKQIDERKTGVNMLWKCPVCQGAHHKDAVHLDYVGHAALTDRMLDADMAWSWEPMAFTQDGLPARDGNGGLWIKLTIDGVSRLGYGAADGKQGGDAVKEIIGDALRNAAMRFGAALDLWHKGDLHLDEETDAPSLEVQAANDRVNNPVPHEKPKRAVKWDGPYSGVSQLKAKLHDVDRTLRGLGDSGELAGYLETEDFKQFRKVCLEHMPCYLDGTHPAPADFVGIDHLVDQMRRDFESIENQGDNDVRYMLEGKG